MEKAWYRHAARQVGQWHGVKSPEMKPYLKFVSRPEKGRGWRRSVLGRPHRVLAWFYFQPWRITTDFPPTHYFFLFCSAASSSVWSHSEPHWTAKGLKAGGQSLLLWLALHLAIPTVLTSLLPEGSPSRPCPPRPPPWLCFKPSYVWLGLLEELLISFLPAHLIFLQSALLRVSLLGSTAKNLRASLHRLQEWSLFAGSGTPLKRCEPYAERLGASGGCSSDKPVLRWGSCLYHEWCPWWCVLSIAAGSTPATPYLRCNCLEYQLLPAVSVGSACAGRGLGPPANSLFSDLCEHSASLNGTHPSALVMPHVWCCVAIAYVPR